ncbi:MAG: DUF4190 domain-containing protein [Lachnospiraceae bacterium]|nr:DUF4190 domain-containing protein [Lachnospiraceae bacterium]
MDNMNGENNYTGTNNYVGNNDYTGVDTSGISAETFGIPTGYEKDSQDGLGSYADSWTSGSYTVPGYNGVEPEPIKKEGRGLEIATLVFGILALIVCCCNGFFGIVGLILGIVALVKGKRSGLSIAGLVCSVIALFFAFSTLVFSMTESGQAFWKGFEEGFNEGMEEQYEYQEDDPDEGTESDDWDTETQDESSVESNEGTSVISKEDAAKVTIDGNVITIPCTLGDVLQYYEVSEYNAEMMGEGLKAHSTDLIYLAQNGEENGIYVGICNDTDNDYTDIKMATVDSINIDDAGVAPVGSAKIFNGISLGMSSAQVEELIKDISYNKSQMNDYVFYNIYAGDKNQYSISLMLSEDKIVNISVYYSNY